MSDVEEGNDAAPFAIEKAKSGRAACKKCKQKLPAGELRMSKVVDNPWGSGKLNHWYHIDCLLESFKSQRATTKTIESLDDISGWHTIGDLDKDSIIEKLEQLPLFDSKSSVAAAVASTAGTSSNKKATKDAKTTDCNYKATSKDNLFREFRKICALLVDESSYLGKTAILRNFFLKGTNDKRFEGKLFMWVKMLLPTVDKRVYNLQSRQLIKLFARVFGVDQADMLTDLEQGDVSETIRVFFEQSKCIRPAAKSSITMDEVDDLLIELTRLSKEDEHIDWFRKLGKRCTSSDLKMIIRFIKHDIRINMGPKNVLNALSKDAYPTFQSSQDLQAVVEKYADHLADNRVEVVTAGASKKKLDGIGVQLMSPISPMLAEACKSVEKAIAKCPQGMYSEIKYDGERIQLHKQGDEFRFFTRNLKPVLEHKTKRCKEFIPQAFPNANDLILDSEILLVDTATGEQLPFGTLGKHKKTAFETAEVCLFVFDCIYYNGEDLTKKPLKERRKILEANISPIKNHVQLSEYHLITKPRELSVMIAKVLQMGLEGLVLKNVNGIYEPGKRHWLKVKKDYLFDGKMADAADLVVLGAWFGSGKKGGMLSIYLMGCRDTRSGVWKTVTKVHTGLDDNTMDKVHKTLMALMTRGDADNPPDWLVCKKALIPDMIAVNPEKMPVWEITGAEFSKSHHHTADGISIRFPRITRQRADKSYKEATTLQELNVLYEASKDCTNLQMLTDGLNDDNDDDDNNDDDIEIKTKIQHKPSGGKNSPLTPKSPSGGAALKRKQKVINENDELPSAKVKAVDVKTEKVASDLPSLADKNTEIEVLDKKPGLRKQKLKYIFDESSNEEEEAAATNAASSSSLTAAKRKPKMPDIFPAMPKTNKKSLDTIGAHNMAEKQPAAILSDVENNSSTETPAAAAKGMVAAKNSDINIFEGVMLYVPSEIRDCVKEELRYFVLWGGTETSSNKKCTHVLHKKDSIAGDWSRLRRTYQPRCKHVQYQWLSDSIKRKEVLGWHLYPVLLLSSHTE